jgi:hypothetical protein
MHSPLKPALLALSFGFAALILATQNAHAQQMQSPANPSQCGPRDTVLGALENTYGEGRRGICIAGSQMVMEIFANLDTGTWSVIATRPDGTTCLIASGTGFEAVSGPAPAKGRKV